MSKPALCVVLGGSGFLGQRLCRSLLNQGVRVRSVSRSGRPNLQSESWLEGVEWITAPIGTELSVSALRDADTVFHLASTTLPSTSNTDIIYDLESNVVATVKIVQAAAALGVRRLIFVSSGGTVYGIARQNPIPENHPTEPICSYGIHKLSIEKYLQIFRSHHGLDSVVLRVSNMYGESQDCARPLGAIAHFTNRALNGTPIEIWGDGSTTRDYVYVDDVVAALMKAAAYRGMERLFNIGSGRGVSLRQLVEMVQQRLSMSVAIEYRPRRDFDVPENVLDVTRAARELLWTPAITLEVGLERMIRAAQGKLTARV